MTTNHNRKSLRILLVGILLLCKCPGLQAQTPTTAPIYVSGVVIDDETGKPISLFSQQGGRVDETVPGGVHWGYSLQTTNSKNPKGRFSGQIDWAGGWRARIIASGYRSQPILTEPPKAGQTRIDGLVIRMKPGRRVQGHVLDFNGKAVKDAGVFIVGPKSLNLIGGRAGESGMELNGEFTEDKQAIRAATDADGAFTVIGADDESNRLAVSSSAAELWVVPVPSGDAPLENFDIHLPQPGKLVIHYDIPGGPDTTMLFMQLHTWEMPGWSNVENNRYEPIKQHGELVFDNLTPGIYVMNRSKRYTMNQIGGGAFLDRRELKIESGKTTVTDFVRTKGSPITGQVFGIEPEEVAQLKPTALCISIGSPDDKGEPIPKGPVFDQVVLNPRDDSYDGKFTSEQLEPGKYKVIAELYVQETEAQKHMSYWRLPAFRGESLVIVPAAGQPQPVKIELAAFHNQPAKENP